MAPTPKDTSSSQSFRREDDLKSSFYPNLITIIHQSQRAQGAPRGRMNHKSTARIELKIGEAINCAMGMPIAVLLHNDHYGSSSLSLNRSHLPEQNELAHFGLLLSSPGVRSKAVG